MIGSSPWQMILYSEFFYSVANHFSYFTSIAFPWHLYYTVIPNYSQYYLFIFIFSIDPLWVPFSCTIITLLNIVISQYSPPYPTHLSLSLVLYMYLLVWNTYTPIAIYCLQVGGLCIISCIWFIFHFSCTAMAFLVFPVFPTLPHI